MRAAVLLLALSACDGAIFAPPPPVQPLPVDPVTPVDPLVPCAPGETSASSPRIRRLSARQYEKTVEAVLGAPLPTEAGNPFSGAPTAGLYRSYSSHLGMPEVTLDELLHSSEVIAAALATQLRAQRACLRATAPTAACVRDAVLSVAQSAFRRPVTDDERVRFEQLATDGLAALGPDALELGLEAVLDSAHFVFRLELGDGAKLTPYEVASALSYTLTDAPPDAALYAAAEAGELGTAAELRPHVERLAAADDAPLLRFFQDWLGYERALVVVKDPAQFPDHDPRALVDETTLLLKDLSTQRQGFLKTLFTTETGFSGTTKVSYPPGERAGILTQPSFLVAYSTSLQNMPVERGKFIREKVMCLSVVGAPPPNVPKLSELPGQTLREKLEVHRADPACASCHRQMDPIGLTLEQYDHVGRFRTLDEGKPVVTSGAIYDLDGKDVLLAGPSQLGDTLASLPQVRRCFVQQSFRHWLGRTENAGDRCSLVDAELALRDSGDDLHALVAALLTSQSFLNRR